MKINEIEISGFKGISKLVLHPKQINILVGKNNTGKTSILEAINSTLDPSRFKMQREYGSHLSNIINVHQKESRVIVKLSNETRYIFLRKPELAEIYVEFKKEVMERLKSISRITPTIVNHDDWKKAEELFDKLLSNDEFIHKIEKESIRIESGNQATCVFSYTPIILKELEPLIEYINKNILHTSRSPLLYFLRDPRLYDSTPVDKSENPLTFIKDLTVRESFLFSLNKSKINEIEKYLKDRKILPNLERFDIDKLLFKNDEREYEIPFSFMGDGLKSLIGLIAYTSKETKIVLIEEPENHMHPAYITEMIRQIIDFSIEKDIQFFITTHNLDILEVVSTDILEPMYQEYLSKELNIIRIDYLADTIVAQELNKAEALVELEEVKIDLRGM